MAGEPETVEIEVSEDDILFYLVDEDGNEVGFVIEEDGAEVECYYEEFEAIEFEAIGETTSCATDGDDTVEIEVSEDDILFYLVDEDGNEVGFVIEEDGAEVECYYEEENVGESGSAREGTSESVGPYVPERAEDHGYLHKLASIAGHEGNKAREKAEVQLDRMRGKAEKQVGKAKAAATEQVGKAKAAANGADLGITREDVKETTADLNAIAKEGAETAKELKEAYDDIMDNFGFLMPKKARRKLP